MNNIDFFFFSSPKKKILRERTTLENASNSQQKNIIKNKNKNHNVAKNNTHNLSSPEKESEEIQSKCMIYSLLFIFIQNKILKKIIYIPEEEQNGVPQQL